MQNELMNEWPLLVAILHLPMLHIWRSYYKTVIKISFVYIEQTNNNFFLKMSNSCIMHWKWYMMSIWTIGVHFELITSCRVPWCLICKVVPPSKYHALIGTHFRSYWTWNIQLFWSIAWLFLIFNYKHKTILSKGINAGSVFFLNLLQIEKCRRNFNRFFQIQRESVCCKKDNWKIDEIKMKSALFSLTPNSPSMRVWSELLSHVDTAL